MNHRTIAEIEEQAAVDKQCGRFAEALALRQELEELYIAERIDVTRQAINLNYLTFLTLCIGDHEGAERAARRTVDIYNGVSDPSSEKMATYLMMLSCVLAERGSFEEAVTFGERALAIFALNHGVNDGFFADVKRNIERMRRSDPGPYIDR